MATWLFFIAHSTADDKVISGDNLTVDDILAAGKREKEHGLCGNDEVIIDAMTKELQQFLKD